jgi:hypothetical protein
MKLKEVLKLINNKFINYTIYRDKKVVAHFSTRYPYQKEVEEIIRRYGHYNVTNIGAFMTCDYECVVTLTLEEVLL